LEVVFADPRPALSETNFKDERDRFGRLRRDELQTDWTVELLNYPLALAAALYRLVERRWMDSPRRKAAPLIGWHQMKSAPVNNSSRTMILAFGLSLLPSVTDLGAISQRHKPYEGSSSETVVRQGTRVHAEEARKAHIEGMVVLEIDITDSGSVINTHVVKSLDDGLDENSIHAVQQWRFESGKPTQALRIELNFGILDKRK
jgi:TonB family protein